MMTKRGIWNIENLDLTRLAADKAYQFLFVWLPSQMKEANGSLGNPVALYQSLRLKDEIGGSLVGRRLFLG